MLVDVRHLAGSVDELLAGAEQREPFVNPDGRSSAAFERVWFDGLPHVVKYVHVDHDFFMRASGDVGCRPVRAWAHGLLDAAPGFVDHAIVGAALGDGRNSWGGALLMRDVSDELVVADGTPLPLEQHGVFLDHVAGFCATTWEWHDNLGRGGQPAFLPYASRWSWFSPAAIECEQSLGWPERVPQLARDGWQRFEQQAPDDLVRAVQALRLDAAPLVAALRTTPSCLLHGDIKASNAGTAADGRTILIDWAYVGEGPAGHELAWHLALDRARLPLSKEATAETFRGGLERHGVDTEPWWEHQLDLCLLGAMVQFGWEKALGEGDEHDQELAWWCAAARRGVARL